MSLSKLNNWPKPVLKRSLYLDTTFRFLTLAHTIKNTAGMYCYILPPPKDTLLIISYPNTFILYN